MPSVHMAFAVFGAISLARKCAPDPPVKGGLASGAAAVVAATRGCGQAYGGAGELVGYFANGVTADFFSGRVAFGYSMKSQGVSRFCAVAMG